MAAFACNAPAGQFPARTRKGRRPIGYRRFNSAAEAIRYPVEPMPSELHDGAGFEIEIDPLIGDGNRDLHDGVSNTLPKKPAPLTAGIAAADGNPDTLKNFRSG
jgi:hypothetical protein